MKDIRGKWSWRSAVVSTAFLVTAGCASVQPQVAMSSSQQGVSEPLAEQACVENSKWVLPGNRHPISTDQFIPSLAEQRVVLLGEFHDNTAHHLWQLQTISALHAANNDLAITLEMLPASAQPALDDWVAGKSDLDTFLKASKWYDYWKFDIDLYLPILEFARINKVPLYGVNVERDLAKLVAEKGWANVPEEQRNGLTDPAPPKTEYLEVLAASFSMHGPGRKSHGHGEVQIDLAAMEQNPNFKRFVQGQQLWDRAMAQGIAKLNQSSPTTKVVMIVGSGHIMNGFGIPNQLADLGVDKVSVLLPWDGDDGCEMITEDVADAVFGVKELPKNEKKDKPKLGVVIENTKDGVRVTEVIKGSLAEEAGIEVGDYFVSIAGVEQNNVMEVIEMVQTTPHGRWLPFVVKRGEAQLEMVAKFPVKKPD